MKLKSFRVHTKNYSDSDVVSERFLDECAEMFKAMAEFVGMLNDVCMPDGDTSDTDDEGEGEEVESGQDAENEVEE